MSQGSRAEKEQKRHAVAFARLAGQGTRATARQIGCSERYVRRLAEEPETQFLITETLRPHIAKLLQLMPKALAVIEEAMSAMKKEGPDHLTMPDYLTRLRAVERFCKLLEMAQGKEQEKGTPTAGQMTWEELTEDYEARRERARCEEDARR